MVVYLKHKNESGLPELLAGFTPVIEPVSSGEVFLEMPRDGIRNLLQEVGRADFRVLAGTGANPLVARAAVLAGIRESGRIPGLVRIPVPEGGTPVFAVSPGKEAAFISALPVELLWPLPEKTRLALRALGLATGGDVAGVGERELRAHFGAAGALIAAYSRGVDPRRVRALYPAPELSRRFTLGGVSDRRVLDGALSAGARHLAARLRREARGYRHLRLEVGVRGNPARLENERRFPVHVPPDPGRLARQLSLLLDGIQVTGPVDELRVTVGAFYRLEPGQVELFSTSRTTGGLERMVAALDDRYPGRLARGGAFRSCARRRERMLDFYDSYRGRLVPGGNNGAQDR